MRQTIFLQTPRAGEKNHSYLIASVHDLIESREQIKQKASQVGSFPVKKNGLTLLSDLDCIVIVSKVNQVGKFSNRQGEELLFFKHDQLRGLTDLDLERLKSLLNELFEQSQSTIENYNVDLLNWKGLKQSDNFIEWPLINEFLPKIERIMSRAKFVPPLVNKQKVENPKRSASSSLFRGISIMLATIVAIVMGIVVNHEGDEAKSKNLKENKPIHSFFFGKEKATKTTSDEKWIKDVAEAIGIDSENKDVLLKKIEEIYCSSKDIYSSEVTKDSNEQEAVVKKLTIVKDDLELRGIDINNLRELFPANNNKKFDPLGMLKREEKNRFNSLGIKPNEIDKMRELFDCYIDLVEASSDLKIPKPSDDDSKEVEDSYDDTTELIDYLNKSKANKTLNRSRLSLKIVQVEDLENLEALKQFLEFLTKRDNLLFTDLLKNKSISTYISDNQYLKSKDKVKPLKVKLDNFENTINKFNADLN